MKNYRLSDENKKMEIKHKEDIETNKIRCDRIYDRIRRIKLDEELTDREKNYQILNAEIEKEELYKEMEISKNRVSGIYIKQAQLNISRKGTDDKTQRIQDDLKSYIELKNCSDDRYMLYNDINILEMKIRLENMKKERGEITQDMQNKNIEKFQKKIEENKKFLEYNENEMKEASYKYEWLNLKNDLAEGKITHKEYKEREQFLDDNKDEIKALGRGEISGIFERIEEKALETEPFKEMEESHQMLSELTTDEHVELLLEDFESEGISITEVNKSKELFNESRERLEREQVEIHKERTERGIW